MLRLFGHRDRGVYAGSHGAGLPGRLLAGRRASRCESMTPDELVDAFFDRELDPHETLDAVEIALRDRAASDKLRETQSMLDALSRPVACPDMTQTILDKVGQRRPWLPPRLQRYVTGGRMATAASLVLLLGAGFVTKRHLADNYDFAVPHVEGGISDVVSTARVETADGLRSLAGAIDLIRTTAPGLGQPTKAAVEAPMHEAPRTLTFVGYSPAPERDWEADASAAPRPGYLLLTTSANWQAEWTAAWCPAGAERRSPSCRDRLRANGRAFTGLNAPEANTGALVIFPED